MSKPTVNDLPPEVLWHALRLAVLPEHFLDHAISRGPFSQWCRNLRTKKVILSICRTWNGVALPILYQDIIIRRFGQFLALSKVLEDNPRRLATVVRCLTVEGFVPSTFLGLFSERLCPRLSTLSCQFILPQPTDIIRIPPYANIAHLSLIGLVQYSPDILRQLGDTLISLAVNVEQSLTEEPGDTSSICFPKLEALSCFLYKNSTSASPLCSKKWKMPSISTLTLTLHSSTPMDVCITICTVYGGRLKALRFIPLYLPNKISAFQQLLEFCPNLDYLYLSCPVYIPSFSHPHLKRIDVGTLHEWLPTCPRDMEIPLSHDFGHCVWKCPELEPDGVRLFARDLGHFHHAELLRETISQLDFPLSPNNPHAGISFENLCICRVKFNRQQVKWIHLLSDHSDCSPIEQDLSLPLPEQPDPDSETSSCHTSDDDSSDASTDEEDLPAEPLASTFEEALEHFADTLARDVSDTDSDTEKRPWQEFIPGQVR